MLNESELKNLTEIAIGYVDGADAEVTVSSTDKALTRYSENVITQNVAGSEVGLSVRLLRDGKMGKASTGNVSVEGIQRCVHTAQAALAVSEADSELPPLPGKQDYVPKPSYFKETHELSPEARAEGVATAVRSCAGENLQAAGIFSNSGTAIAIANSKGIWAHHKASEATFSVSAMSEDSSGWAENRESESSRLGIEQVVSRAIRKSLEGRHPGSIEPGAYTVIFEPAAVADFLLFLSWEALNGLAFAEGRSCFSGKTGRKVVGENVTLCDDFTHPLTPGRPFDYEGMARQKVIMIENGIFITAVHDRKTAGLTGSQNTGHALPQPDTYGPLPLNLVMSPGESSLEEMIASTSKGLLITRLHYSNILNPMTMILTGMTRDGFYEIRDGRIARGLKNMRYTESVLHILSNIEAMSSEQYKTETFWGGGGTVAPAIKVNDFHFTSKTEN